jgi:hypothetical protein
MYGHLCSRDCTWLHPQPAPRFAFATDQPEPELPKAVVITSVQAGPGNNQVSSSPWRFYGFLFTCLLFGPFLDIHLAGTRFFDCLPLAACRFATCRLPLFRLPPSSRSCPRPFSFDTDTHSIIRPNTANSVTRLDNWTIIWFLSVHLIHHSSFQASDQQSSAGRLSNQSHTYPHHTFIHDLKSDLQSTDIHL